MAYTPINWQTGDTITAEKLNRCDNGWSVGGTVELFSESVTTEYNSEAGFSMGTLVYDGELNAEVILVDFEGTTYSCPRIDAGYGSYIYGGFGEFGPDFSEIPFLIQSVLTDGVYMDIVATADPGSYDVAASVESDAVEVSQGFVAAVNAAAPLPLRCVSGVTTMGEMDAARTAGRMMYAYYGGVCYFVSSFTLTPDSPNAVSVYPNDTYINAGFDSDSVFAITDI